LAPSRTSPSAVDVASERSLEADDADVYACYLHDLRQELQEPPEFVLCDEFRPAARPRRDYVIRDRVALRFD
jgi:hypothetical protein